MLGWRVLSHWLFGDRIRVSTREGQFLRLKVNDLLLHDDQVWRVSERQTFRGPGAYGVRYRLSECTGERPDAARVLWIDRDDPQLEWIIDSFDKCWLECRRESD